MGNLLGVDSSSEKDPNYDILFYDITPESLLEVTEQKELKQKQKQNQPSDIGHHQYHQKYERESEKQEEKREPHGDGDGDGDSSTFTTMVDDASATVSVSDTSLTFNNYNMRPPMTASSASSSTSISFTMNDFYGNGGGGRGRTANSLKSIDSIQENKEQEHKQEQETNAGERKEDGDKREQDGIPTTNTDVDAEEDFTVDELDLLGVSVHHIRHELYPKLISAGYGPHSKIYIIENLNNAVDGFSSILRDKGKQVFCPIDGRIGASYAHAVLYKMENSSSGNSDEKLKEEFKSDVDVARASIMVSYSWDYAIGDVVDTLSSYCRMNGLDERSTYVWIDFLCVNFHRIVDLKQEERLAAATTDSDDANENITSTSSTSTNKNKNTMKMKMNMNIDKTSIFATMDELRLTVQHRIQNIGHVLAIASPYQQPVYLTRLWCLYELSVAYNQLMIQTMILKKTNEHENGLGHGHGHGHDQQGMMNNFKMIMNDENFNFNFHSSNNNGNDSTVSPKITIAIPPKQQELLLEQMNTNTIRTIQDLYDIIYNQIHIQSPSCRTTVQDDRQIILNLIQIGQPQPLLPSSPSPMLMLDSSNHSPSKTLSSLKNDNNRFLQRNDKYHGFHSSMKELMRNWVTHLILSTVELRRITFLRQFSDDNINANDQDVDDSKTTRASNSSSIECIIAREGLASFYNQVAYAFRKNDDFDNALEVYEKSLEAKKGLVGLDFDFFFSEVGIADVSSANDSSNVDVDTNANSSSPTVAGAVNSTALDIQRWSKISDKRKRKKSSGDDSNVYKLNSSKHKTATLSIATTYSSIATVLQKLNRLNEAMVNLRKCLAIRQLILSPNNLTIASTYNAIAELLQKQGKWVEALELNHVCQSIYEAVLGKNHPSTATIYDSIASQLQSMGRLDEAMAMYRKALKIREVELGYHTHTAASYGHIALLLEDTGEIEDALRMYKKCVKVQEVAIGARHPNTAATYNNIARILLSLGKKEEALSTWTKALGVLKENIGPDVNQVLVQALVDKLAAK